MWGKDAAWVLERSPGSLHTEESPSTVSTTPDSTDGGNDESDFPELQTAREFSEDEEEETSLDWGTPRELTFSYITFAGGPDAIPPSEPGPRGRRDSLARRMRGPLPRPETCETLVPGRAGAAGWAVPGAGTLLGLGCPAELRG
ncbi:Reticulon-2 [Chelonia mydas]|uniref:Reticulon-2 n=1 Tax=Chelonia mydas TaxID=8469 RepID=M7B526_CHEMY|nr:Reticulon-2 [Chelonia mydas]